MFQNATVALSMSVLAAIAVPVTLVLALMVCLSCLDKFRRRPLGGFSNFSNNGEANTSASAAASNAHVNNSFSMDMEDTNVDTANPSAISLEPLPDIPAKAKLPTCPLRPRIGAAGNTATSDTSLKQIVTQQPFPRSQIVYLKELGSGWFGKVIESDAEKISPGASSNKVVVKMLKDDASKDEQQLFFDEVSAFRSVDHPNIVRVLGQCTEISPMLMLLEFAPFGSLKQYLRNHRQEQASLVHKNRLIQFAVDASKGVECLHGHDIIHRDLAARNCLVMSDHTLKIGDYGIAEDLFKEEYLTAGSDLLPIRWMAPESLKQENGTWTAAGFTKESDVWSLGVVVWEVAMLGERPYDMLTDQAVLQGVIVDRDIRLPQPDTGMAANDRLYEVMRFCWMEAAQRVKVGEVVKLLEKIGSQARQQEGGAPTHSITAFEQKWEHLMPNQRHESLDSTGEEPARRGSESSDDSNLLNYSGSNSLEDITGVGVVGGGAPSPSSVPTAPPRANRRKLSVRRVTIPGADDAAEEEVAQAAATQVRKHRPAPPPPVPKISVVDDSGRQLQQQQTEKSGEADRSSKGSTEFTEFTSHSTDDDDDDDHRKGEDTPNVSQIVSETETGRGDDTNKDVFQADSAPSKAKESVEGAGFGTPDKSHTPQATARKTSTPMSQAETSPAASSSALSVADSTATFVTAGSSSPGNLTEAFMTASENTLATDRSKSDLGTSPELSTSGEISVGSSSMTFEILDTTAVPSPLEDSSRSEGETNATKVSDPFSDVTFNNPFTGDAGSVARDDSFGEFTNGSLAGDTSSASPKDSGVASAHGDSPEVAPKPPDNNAASLDFQTASASGEPAAETSNPFASFQTDLPSLGSLTVETKAAESTDQQQQPEFSSFTSEFSPFGSLQSESTTTPTPPQADPYGDLFGLGPELSDPASGSGSSVLPQSQQPSSAPGLGDFSFDLISSVPDVVAGSAPQSVGTAEKGSSEDQVSATGTAADFSSVPLDSGPGTNPFVSGGGSPNSSTSSSQQQAVPDLFGGLGDPPASGLQESSFEVVSTSQDGSQASMTSSALSDFDMLASFTAPSGLPAAPDPSSSSTAASLSVSSNPFAGGGAYLLQDFGGSLSSAAPGDVEKKESQDDVLVANASSTTDQSKSPDTSLLDFSAFESSGPSDPDADPKPDEEGQSETSTTASTPSGANSAAGSSLIDF